MPDQRHNGEAVEICEHSGRVYGQAGELHPKRWTGLTRCWRQPEVAGSTRQHRQASMKAMPSRWPVNEK